MKLATNCNFRLLIAIVVISQLACIVSCQSTLTSLVQQLERNGELLWTCQLELGTTTTAGVNSGRGQSFKVLVDTGSSDLWLVSTACTSELCLKRRRFDAEASSSLTYSNNRTISVNYGGDCRVKGVEARDSLRLAGTVIEQQSFLLVDSLAGSIFKQFQFDGVLGLGSKFLSQLKALTPFEQMIKRNLIGEQMFSLRLNAKLPLPSWASGGELIFGSISGNYSREQFKMVAQTTNTRWQFQLQEISLRSQTSYLQESTEQKPQKLASVCRQSAQCSALVDSGSALILGPSAEVRHLNGVLGAVEGPGGLFAFPNCSVIAQLPNLVFAINLKGDQLELKANEYVLERVSVDQNNETSVKCYSGLAMQRASDDYNFWILGNIFLSNYYTLFDYGNKQIGFI